MTLPTKKRLVSYRATVPASTPVNTPASIRAQLQNPIIESLYVYALGATIHESGFRVLVNGFKTFPAMESGGLVPGWIPLGVDLRIEGLGLQIPGAPYNIEIQFYNANGSTPYYAAVVLLTSPKIDLPLLPIEEKTGKEKDVDS
jgi:hypothetical protein